MIPSLRYTLLRLRGQIIGWGLALAALSLLVVPLYDMAVQQRAQIEGLIKSLPPELLMFVGSFDRMFSPAGFLDTRYFSMLPLILGVFTVVIGSGLIVSDEENGTLDLILAQPVSRVELYIGRWLAFSAALIGILFIAWLGLIAGIRIGSIDLNGLAVARPFISLFCVLSWFGGLALMLSLIAPSRRQAASLSGLVLVASYFVTTLAKISTDLSGLATVSPLTYYQGGAAIETLNAGDALGLAMTALGFVVIGLWLFQRRDIRIAGEGGWRLPRLAPRHPRT
ncbi:MAG TPA: ABC transporter permease subunit [Anaerolineae bacterium]|nr:ABC transporter permease subunit [Anaerolineae bacterium]